MNREPLSGWKRTHNLGELAAKDDGAAVTLMGVGAHAPRSRRRHIY